MCVEEDLLLIVVEVNAFVLGNQLPNTTHRIQAKKEVNAKNHSAHKNAAEKEQKNNKKTICKHSILQASHRERSQSSRKNK